MAESALQRTPTAWSRRQLSDRRCRVFARLAFELTRRRSLSRSTPDVDDTNDLGAVIDGEEYAINVRAAPRN